MLCFFASDLHGRIGRFEALFRAIDRERPRAVFLGGDLLPSFGGLPEDGETVYDDFLVDYVLPRLKGGTPDCRVFLIPGNDDPRSQLSSFEAGEREGAWELVLSRGADLDEYRVFGYPYVPPTPFLLKDWERYDVSRYVDPGCVSPEEGRRSVPVSAREVRLATIAADLDRLCSAEDLSRAILLFHTPPYGTHLDRAGLDGRSVDHVPLDVHVGSIAVRRFIEQKEPLITLHGHVHESTQLTGVWHETLGRTHMYQAAHSGAELALIRFDPADPAAAQRELIP